MIVILTADTGLAEGMPREIGPHTWLTHWTRRMDMVDHIDTEQDRRPQNQSIMRYTIPRVTTNYLERAPAIIEATIAGYRQAAAWAGPGGEIFVLFDHGAPGELFVAPARTLFVTPAIMAAIDATDRRQLDDRQRAIIRIGEALRGNRAPQRRIARVTFLSCSVGVGQEGQDLVNWLHYLWQIPVRAPLGVFSHPEGRYSLIEPPGACGPNVCVPFPSPPFGTRYYDTPPLDPGLYRQSTGARPQPPP